MEGDAIAKNTVPVADRKVCAWTVRGVDIVVFKIPKGVVNEVRILGRIYRRSDAGECHFLKLPAEIRDMIWDYHLVSLKGGVKLRKA